MSENPTVSSRHSARARELPPLDLALEFEQYGYDVEEGDECQGSGSTVEIEDEAAECWVCGKTWANLNTACFAAILPIHRGEQHD